MGLSTQEQILIEQRVANEAKSTGLAYVLWFFTNLIGGHRFYLGYTRTGLAMLALTVCGVVLAPYSLVFSGALLSAVILWSIADIFLIPGMVQGNRDEVRKVLGINAMVSSVADMPVDTSKWSRADRKRFMEQQMGKR